MLEWSHPLSLPFYAAVALALVAFLFLARRFSSSDTARSWPLLILRACALLILVVVLLNPVRVRETRLPPRSPSALFLIDGSRSMTLDRPTSRLDAVRSALAQVNAEMAASPKTKLSQFRFGSDLAPVAGAHEVLPVDDSSRLLWSLERLPSRFGDDLPKGVFVFSDGRDTDEGAIDDLATGYRELGVPIHAFAVGDPNVAGDVAIRGVVAPRDVPSGATVSVQVVSGSRGYAGRRAEVRIKSDENPAAAPLAVLPITLTDREQSHELAFESDKAAGRLVVEIPVLANESIAENNRVAFEVRPLDRKLRVIYMEGTTGLEYRFIHDALVADPNIECLSMVADYQYTATQSLFRVDGSGRGYPTTREELFGYDVVICSDISFHTFSQQQLDWTVELVRDRGGGFAMIGGMTSFGAGSWNQTVWDKLIPIDMSGSPSGPNAGTLWNQNFGVRIPPDAVELPIWQIVDDPEQNRQVLSRIPHFYGTNLTDRVKPGATVLGYAEPPIAGYGAMPILTSQTYGAGRTFAMSPDSTVDWGRDFERLWGEGDNRYFQKFWRNAVTWLGEKSAGRNRRLRIETDKLMYKPGEEVRISAKAYDDDYAETDAYRVVARFEPSAKSQGAATQGAAVQGAAARGSNPPAAIGTAAQLDAIADATGKRGYQGRLAGPPIAEIPASAAEALTASRTLTLRVTAYDGDTQKAEATVDLQVIDDPVELHDPRPDRARLERLASASGGKLIGSADEIVDLLKSYENAPGETTVSRAPIWDSPLLWTLIVGLLSTEWLVRRWKGLA